MGMFDDILVEFYLPTAAGAVLYEEKFQFKDMPFPYLETYKVDTKGRMWQAVTPTHWDPVIHTGSIAIETDHTEWQLFLVNGLVWAVLWRPCAVGPGKSPADWEVAWAKNWPSLAMWRLGLRQMFKAAKGSAKKNHSPS